MTKLILPLIISTLLIYFRQNIVSLIIGLIKDKVSQIRLTNLLTLIKTKQMTETNAPIAAGTPGEVLEKVNCYIGNVSELLEAFQTEFIEQDGAVVKIRLETAKQMLQLLWDKVKEVALECEGKEIQVELPESTTGDVIRFLLNAVGFKL